MNAAADVYLREAGHEIRVLDVNPPAHDVEFVEGSISDAGDVRAALKGVDSFIVMLRSTAAPTCSVTSDCMNLLKPSSSALIEYLPGDRPANRYTP